MREHNEVPVVSKEARVVEKIRVGTESQERTETIRETVRNTEVEVENFADQSADQYAERKRNNL